METLNPALFGLIVLLSCLVAARLVRWLTMRSLNLLASRSRSGRTNAWVTRLPRVGIGSEDNLEIFRRDQRIRATSMLISRVVNTLLVVLGVVLILLRLDVDIAWLVGSAGFLGLGLAISAQYSLQDFINGFHVLFEDRFFEGDEIEVGAGEHRTVGRVERVGMFSTRLRDEHVTLHIANRELVQIRNRSQRGYVLRLDLGPDAPVSEDQVRNAVEGALHDITEGATPGVVIDRVVSEDAQKLGLDARLTAPLTTREHAQLADEVRRRLRGGVESEDQ